MEVLKEYPQPQGDQKYSDNHFPGESSLTGMEWCEVV